MELIKEKVALTLLLTLLPVQSVVKSVVPVGVIKEKVVRVCIHTYVWMNIDIWMKIYIYMSSYLIYYR